MHDDELEIDEQTVRRLVDDQFPEWRSLAIRPVPGAGTVNAIFRIGEDYTARFPLTGEAGPIAETLRREAVALAELADACPVPAPQPVALGAPDTGHPLPWSIQTWIPGTVATPTSVSHSAEFAGDLVKLVEALRDVDTRGRAFGGIGRGGDLKDSDEWMATCFRESTDLLPVDRLRALWERMRLLPGAGALAMTHGDLIPATSWSAKAASPESSTGEASARRTRHWISSPGGIFWMPTSEPSSGKAWQRTTWSGAGARAGRSSRPWDSSGTTSTPTRR